MVDYDYFLDSCESEGLKTQRKVSGADVSTYRVGGDLSHVITLASLDDVTKLGNVIATEFPGNFETRDAVCIGRGSNIVIDDKGFSGIVFLFSDELATWQGPEENSEVISVPAGVALPMLARQCVAQGLSGIEFYVGIPGSVGGAVAMNAGGHGKQTSDVLRSCTALDLTTGAINTFTNKDCQFSYRHSRFSTLDVVVSAEFNVVREDSDDLKSKLDEIVQWRRDNQPGGRNVGSVFQNPPDTSAGALIEQCGLKNFRVGGAYVSEKHANFIQADENATAEDIRNLINHVRDVVAESTGTILQTEVRFIGTHHDG